MRYGFVFPSGDSRDIAELSRVAELAGWDGVFVWDPVWGVDAWVTLAAIALSTERIRMGTMLTPVSRRRPWKLAGETATVDRLSRGRLILSVGLGAVDTGFEAFGEVTDRKVRAELLDEGLQIVTGLWAGQPFAFQGKHYHVRETEFFPPPPPVQQPRIPIWVVGLWPSPRSMSRAARWDGLLPYMRSDNGAPASITPDDIRAMSAWVQVHRHEGSPYDIVMEGRTSGESRQEIEETIRPLAEAGVTWWLEAMWTEPNDLHTVRKRLELGPPRVSPVEQPIRDV